MAIAFSKIKSKLGLDDTIPFGRYQGYTVEEILKDMPEYISWLMSNTSLRFYPSVHEMLLMMLPKRAAQHTRIVNRRLNDYDELTYPDIEILFDDVPF